MKLLRWERRAVVLAFCAFGALRFAQIGLTVTADESYTLGIAFQDRATIRRSYQTSNNHVLVTLMANAVDRLSEKRQLFSLEGTHWLQLPSIVASVMTLFLVFRVGAETLGRKVGLVAMTAVGVSYPLLMYSHMIRAYGLLTCSTFAALWLGGRCLRETDFKKRLFFGSALSGAILFSNYLIPLGAFYLAPLALWGLVEARWRKRFEAGKVFFGAFLFGGILTLAAYRPILDQVLRGADQVWMESLWISLLHVPWRLYEIEGALALGKGVRIFFMLGIGLGAWSLWKRRAIERYRSFGLLAAFWVGVPLALWTFMGLTSFRRTVLPMVPMLMIVFALGAREATGFLSRGHRSLGRGWAFASILAVVVFAAGDVWAFVSWKRGERYEPVFKDLLRDARKLDDFVVHFPPEPMIPGVSMPGPLSYPDWVHQRFPKLRPLGQHRMPHVWNYYASSANLHPFRRVLDGPDVSPVARRVYYVVARNEGEWEKAVGDLGLDPVMRSTRRAIASAGSFRLYKVERGPEQERRYREIAADEKAEPEERLAAASHLAAAELTRGNPLGALKRLEPAVRLDPFNERTLFLVAYSHYLLFNDEAAERGFRLLASRFPEHMHVRLFWAQTLATLGRTQEAMDLYRWYLRSDLPGHGWFLVERAARAVKFLSQGKTLPRGDFPTAEHWKVFGTSLHEMGAFERAAVAFRVAWFKDPKPEYRVLWSSALGSLRRFAEASRVLEKIEPGEREPLAWIGLSNFYKVKFRIAEARDALRMARITATAEDLPTIEARGRELSRLRELD